MNDFPVQDAYGLRNGGSKCVFGKPQRDSEFRSRDWERVLSTEVGTEEEAQEEKKR